MHIAVTSKFSSNFFSNGLNQNLVLLYEALELCGFQVFFLDFSNLSKNEKLQKHSFIDNKNIFNYYSTKECPYIDILLCPGVAANQQIKDYVKKTNPNCKFVGVKYGNNLITDIEDCFLNEEPEIHSIEKNRNLDFVLYSPHYKFAKEYYEFTCQCPSAEMPYIWSPKFTEEISRKNNLNIEYKPQEKPNIAVFEPNLNISKNSYIPFLSLIGLLEKHEDIFNEGYIFSNIKSEKLSKLSKFLYSETILKDKRKKIFFDPRQITPTVLNRDNPIVLSHQFLNELNYLHLEAIYYNFPLVHNSPAFKDYGYFYNDFNVLECIKSLELCIQEQKSWNPKENTKPRNNILSKYSLESNVENIKNTILQIL
jgi:hypothetical protein